MNKYSLILLMFIVFLATASAAADKIRVAIFVGRGEGINQEIGQEIENTVKDIYEKASLEVIDNTIAAIKLRKENIDSLNNAELVGKVIGADLIYQATIEHINPDQSDKGFEREVREYTESIGPGIYSKPIYPISMNQKKKKYWLGYKCLIPGRDEPLYYSMFGGDSKEELANSLNEKMNENLKNIKFLKGHVTRVDGSNLEINLGSADGVMTDETISVIGSQESSEYKSMFNLPQAERFVRAKINKVETNFSFCSLPEAEETAKVSVNDEVIYLVKLKRAEKKEEKNLFQKVWEMF